MKPALLAALALFALIAFATPNGMSVSSPDALYRALDAVAADSHAPREIRLAPGDYYLPRPIDLARAHSNLVIRGAGPEKTRLWGGVRVTGWTREPGTPFYQAALPPHASGRHSFRTLIKDGVLAPIATLPGGTNRFSHLGVFAPKILSSLNGGWQRKPTDEERRRMPYRVEDLSDSIDLPNADIRLFHMWSDSLCTVSNVDRAAHVLWTSQPANWAMGAADRRHYEVLNVREGMKKPGQWYLDRAHGIVHYWPMPGEDMSKLHFIAPTLPYVIGVSPEPRDRTPKKDRIRDITLADFAVGASAPPVSEMSGFGASAITAAINARHVLRLRLENLHVAKVGGAGFELHQAVNCALAGNDVRDTGARGVGVRDGSGNLIVSNRIADVGTVYRGACGLQASGEANVIRRNEICRIPYCGIIGGGDRALIEENYVHHVMQVLHDGGAIYGNLTRAVLRGNVVHDIVPDGKGFGVHAYYPDEGSVDCLIENNYAGGVEIPVHCHMTARTVLRGNTFVARGPMKLSFSRSLDCAASNNTLVCAGALSVADPDAVSHWENNFAVRPSDEKDPLSKRLIGPWRPARPPQAKRADYDGRVFRVATAPTLDKVFGHDEWPLSWQHLNRTPDRHLSGFTGALVRFTWDDTHLYVAFKTSAFRFCTMSSGSTWGKDDGVELVFSNRRRIRAYFSGATCVEPASFAAAGVRVIGGKDPAIVKPWENQNIANFEIAVPWSALGLKPKAGLRIPFNAAAFVSEYNQLKLFEGTEPFADGTPAGETPAILTLMGKAQ